MRQADTINGDKYFHCKANCEASRRGKWGKPLLAQFQALEKFGIEILKMIHLNNQQKMNSRMRMADALDPTLIFLVIWLARHSGHHPL